MPSVPNLVGARRKVLLYMGSPGPDLYALEETANGDWEVADLANVKAQVCGSTCLCCVKAQISSAPGKICRCGFTLRSWP